MSGHLVDVKSGSPARASGTICIKSCLWLPFIVSTRPSTHTLLNFLVLGFHCQRERPRVLQEQARSASALVAVLGHKKSWTRSSLAKSSSYFRPCHPSTKPLPFNVRIAAESHPPLPNRPDHDCERLPDTTRTDISLHFDMPTVYMPRLYQSLVTAHSRFR